jgi:hypothetical protein
MLEQLGTNVFPFHGYAELYLGGKWVKATPAFDLKMCEKNRIIPVELGRVMLLFILIIMGSTPSIISASY